MTWLSMFVLTLISSLFLPWWCIPIAGFLSGILHYPQKYKSAFGIGFICVAVIWVGVSLYFTVQNEFILVGRIQNMLSLPHKSFVFLLQALIGGLMGGLACASGLAFMKLIKDKS